MEADYLVIGAGAMGLAFTDVLVTESDKKVVIVDRRDQPGGHWNDAYPFVRLHQPSSFYGVNSRPLGNNTIDSRGSNKDMYELAGKSEVCAYFDRVMRDFLDSGQVEYFPMSEYEGNGEIRSLVSNERHKVATRKTVDASYMNVTVPSMKAPAYEVCDGMHCVPPNALARIRSEWENYVVIGAGKTGMDACLFLLASGLSPERISWIKPRESWLWDRANVQADKLFKQSIQRSTAEQIIAAAESTSVGDLFARGSAIGQFVRIDESTAPTMFRCATVSQKEILELRRIRNVIRLGRVQRIEQDRIVLEQGNMQTGPGTLHIDCSADGLATRPAVPIFNDAGITLQSVRTCQQVFSAAFIAHIELTGDGNPAKNLMCTPVPHPDTDIDYLRTLLTDLANGAQWQQDESLMAWLKNARLDFSTHPGTSPEADREMAQTMEPVALVAAQKLQAYLSAL